ncbi:Protein of unknown function [Gryllus bimaculatus]|nr:Protein of unknown function [Gryllus bimaculatus]
MLFHVLAGLRELLRQVEATLPRGRRFLTQQLDSALALAERTAMVVSLSPALPPMPAVPQDDQGQVGVNETNLLPSTFSRLFLLLPQTLVIFTTMMVVVIGLLLSAPVYTMHVVWRGTNFRWSGRIVEQRPSGIVLWLRSRRLLLRHHGLEDARQLPARDQVPMHADIGVGPAESNSEDTPVLSELVESGSQDASGSQAVQGADRLSQGLLSGTDSPLLTTSPDSASFNADSLASLRMSDSPLAHHDPPPGALPSYLLSSASSSSVYITSAASATWSRSPSPKSSDSEAISAHALSSRAVPSSPRSLQAPSESAAPRLSPRPPSRIPVPIGRLLSPASREHGGEMVNLVSGGRGQSTPGHSQSHTWPLDSSERGFTSAGTASHLHGSEVSSDELQGLTSGSGESVDRVGVSSGIEATFFGSGNPSRDIDEPSSSQSCESPVKLSPSRRQSPGRPRTSLQLQLSPAAAPHSRQEMPLVGIASEPSSQTDSCSEMETTTTILESSDIELGSRSSVPFVNSEMRALSLSNIGPEMLLILLEAPSSTDKSRSPSPGQSVMAPAPQPLYSLPISQRSRLPPNDSSSDEAPSRSEQLVTPESSSPARLPSSQTSGRRASPGSRPVPRDVHTLSTGRLATPETSPTRQRPSPKKELFPTTETTPGRKLSPASGSIGSRGSASPGGETLTQASEHLTTPDSSPSLSPNANEPISRGSRSPAQQSPSATSGRLGPQEQMFLSPDSPSRKRKSPRRRLSPSFGSPSGARVFQFPEQQSLSPSRQTNVSPRGEISANSGPQALQYISPRDSRSPKSVAQLSPFESGSRRRDPSRSPPTKRLYSERDLPSQSSPSEQPCSSDSLSPATNSVQSPRAEALPTSTQESNPSPKSAKSSHDSPSSSSPYSVLQSLSEQSGHPFSPSLPGESPGLPVGAASDPSHMLRPNPQLQSPVRVTESCFRSVPMSSLSSPIFYPPDPSVPQPSSSSPSASTSNASPDSTANLQRFALTRASSSTFSHSAHMSGPSTSNQSCSSPSTSSQSAPARPTGSASRARRPARSFGMTRWPPMAELAAAAAAATASSGYETIETSEDTSTCESSSHGSYGEDCSSTADTSGPDSMEADTENAGRTPGVRRQLPVHSASQPEFSSIPAQNASSSKQTNQRPEGEVDAGMPTPSSSTATWVHLSPSRLAAYAAIGQGPSPNHPSGFVPLACLAEPLGDAVDPAEFPSLARPLFQDDEPTERIEGTAEPSGSAGGSSSVQSSKDPAATNDRSPGLEHPVPADSTDEVSSVSADSGSQSQPADRRTGGGVPLHAEMQSPSTSTRVSPSPSVLAAYAAIGQGPSPDHPSGFVPLACLAVPLGDAADPAEFPSLARPLFQDDEPTGRIECTAEPSGSAGGSSSGQPSKEPAATNDSSPGPKPPVPADCKLPEPADFPQINKPVDEAEILDAMEESSPAVSDDPSTRNETGPSAATGGPTEGFGPGTSSGDGGTTSNERRPSVVGVVLSLADLASAILTSSSTATTPTPPPLVAQSAEEVDVVSSTVSELPSFPGYSPWPTAELAEEVDAASRTPSDLPSLSPSLNLYLAVNLPLLADALGIEADRSSCESKNSQEMKKAHEGSDGTSSEFIGKPGRGRLCRSVSKDAESTSSVPLSSHSSLELTEFIESSEDDTPSHTHEQLEDLEETVIEHSSSPGSGDQPSNSTDWAMVPASESTSNFSRDDGNCTNEVPKE